MPRRASPSLASVLYTRNHARQCAMRMANMKRNSRNPRIPRQSHTPDITLSFFPCRFFALGESVVVRATDSGTGSCVGGDTDTGTVWFSASLDRRGGCSSSICPPLSLLSAGNSLLATPFASISLPDLRGGVGGIMRHVPLSLMPSFVSTRLGNGGSQGFLPGSFPSALSFPFPS